MKRTLSVVLALPLCGGLAAIAAGLGETGWGIHPVQPAAVSLISAHWAHIDLTHALLNAAGWTLAVALLRHQPRAFLAVAMASAAVISSWWILYGTSIYLGLSGVLYGLFAYLFAAEAMDGRNVVRGLGGLTLLALGAGGGLADPVVAFAIAHEAHLLGGATGVIAALLNAVFICMCKREAPKQSAEPTSTPSPGAAQVG